MGNVGDSRAILCSDGRASPLSNDHKPNKPEEKRRIHALGGRVVYSFGIPRGEKYNPVHESCTLPKRPVRHPLA